MTQLLAVPKPGLTPRDPRTTLIVPPEGVLVPEFDPYWQGLARFGDVELREAGASAEAEAKAPAPPSPAPVGER